MGGTGHWLVFAVVLAGCELKGDEADTEGPDAASGDGHVQEVVAAGGVSLDAS